MLPSGSRSKYVLMESHPENPSWTVMCHHLYWMELSHLLGLLFFLTFLPGEIELLGWHTRHPLADTLWLCHIWQETPLSTKVPASSSATWR